MDIQILFSNAEPKYQAIYEQLKEMIVDSTLKGGEKLPSKRALALHLQVSVHTVKEAYDQLLAEGYIYSKERSGYYISPYEVDWSIHHVQQEVKMKASTSRPMQYNFRNGQVDEQAFPMKEWLKIYKQQLNADVVANGEWQGEVELREQIVQYLKKAKGLQCDAAQVFIYSGTQHQLQELCRFFGQVHAAMEEPGFRRATSVFLQQALPLQFVAIDDKGAIVPKAPCKLYYITPAHQFPLGGVMPIERKYRLLNWANETDAYILEDDYDSEFRYKGKPIPPLAQLDQLQRVIYFGTFSKTLLPSLRISYVVLPKSLIAPFNDYNKDQKTTVSKVDQLVIAEFMRSGSYARHIAKMRTLYRKKRERLIDGIRNILGPAYDIIGDEAGLHIVLKLPNWLDEQQAILLAREASIAIDPISTSYQTREVQQYVMVGYGAIALHEIDEALEQLASKWNR